MSSIQALSAIAITATAVILIDWVLRERRKARRKARNDHPSNGRGL